MKKTPRPHSQLILLSSEFEQHIDLWFSGSVIFEIDLQTEYENYEELLCVTETLRLLDECYKKATIVINPKESAITLCQLSGRFQRIIYVVGESGYTALFSFSKCVSKFFELKHHIESGRSEAICMKRLVKFDAPETFKLYNPNSSLSKLIKQHDSYIGQLKRVFNKTFI